MTIIPNITYQSVLAGITNIEERNKVFNSLDPQPQRLEIAWDALQLVVLGKVNASYGDYWSQSLRSITGTSEYLQDVLVNNLPECTVCQRGLMMVSQIRLGNQISPYDGYRYAGVAENIKGFSIKVFAQLESEYENSTYNHPYFNNTNHKLANICCNILANGDFNIHDKTDYLIVNEQAGF